MKLERMALLTKVWLVVWTRDRVGSFSSDSSRVTIAIDGRWRSFGRGRVAELVRIEDESGHGGEVYISRFVPEYELRIRGFPCLCDMAD